MPGTNAMGAIRRTWLLAVFGSVMVTMGCSHPEIEVAISQQALQEKMAPKFPLERKVLIADVTLHDPNVYLTGDKVGMKVGVDAIFLKYPLKGTVDVQGGLRYVPETGQFFVTNIKLVDIEVSNSNMVNSDKLKQILEPLIADALQNTPVYTLPDETAKQQLVGTFLKKVAVRNGSLIATFGK